MHAIHVALYIVGAVLFLIAGLGKGDGKANLVALGLLAWILNPTIDALRA